MRIKIKCSLYVTLLIFVFSSYFAGCTLQRSGLIKNESFEIELKSNDPYIVVSDPYQILNIASEKINDSTPKYRAESQFSKSFDKFWKDDSYAYQDIKIVRKVKQFDKPVMVFAFRIEPTIEDKNFFRAIPLEFHANGSKALVAVNSQLFRSFPPFFLPELMKGKGKVNYYFSIIIESMWFDEENSLHKRVNSPINFSIFEYDLYNPIALHQNDFEIQNGEWFPAPPQGAVFKITVKIKECDASKTKELIEIYE